VINEQGLLEPLIETSTEEEFATEVEILINTLKLRNVVLSGIIIVKALNKSSLLN
jgi:hypothetical protein